MSKSKYISIQSKLYPEFYRIEGPGLYQLLAEELYFEAGCIDLVLRIAEISYDQGKKRRVKKKETEIVMEKILLAKAISALNNQYGKNVVRTINETGDVEVIQTDIHEFNTATNLGGIPMGRVMEIAGPQSSGKTTLTWQIGASLQKRTKKKILFYDYERTTSRNYLEKLGVDVDKVIFVVPEKNSLEDGFETCNVLLHTGEFCLVIFDSLAAMNPRAELAKVEEKGFGVQIPMVKAKAMAECLRNSLEIFRDSNVPVIFINHLIAKPAMNGMPQFGDPEETPGGNALKFYSDIRITLKPMGFVTRKVGTGKMVNGKEKQVTIKLGREVKMTLIKNKVADPYGSEVITLRTGKGFDKITSVLKRAVKQGVVVTKSTGAHSLKGDEKIQAKSYEKFYDLTCANPAILSRIESLLDGTATGDFDSKTIDVSAAERELTLEELGSNAEVLETAEDGPISLD